nr:hypothetical protein [Tanacetum cinerariifolium]
MISSTIATTTPTSQAPILPPTISSDVIQHLPSFGSLIRFDDRLRSLEQNFSKVMQKNQFAGAVSAIPRIVQHYMDQRMNEAVQAAVQLQLDQLREETQRENDEFLRTMELKKILIEKIEGNKSIQRSDEQRNLYKALVDAYESDKIILDTYEESVTLKRRRDDDEDKDEEPFARPDRGSTTGFRSRQASASESAFVDDHVQTTSQMEEPSHPEFETGADDQPIIQSSKHPEWFSQPQKPLSLDHDWNKTLPAVHESIQPWISKLAKQADTHSSFNELMDTPSDFSNFIMNRLRVNTLTPELLAGPTYDLVKGSCKSLIELEYHLEEVYKATTDQLDWVNPEGVSHWGRKHQQFYGFAVNQEFARDVYSKRRIITVTELKIVEWHSYKHLDWITNKEKKNRLMRIDELHKFSDRTLTDVRTALDDRLKRIRIRYLPQTICRKSDKDRATAMIQAIDKRLKTRRIIRSLERFVG